MQNELLCIARCLDGFSFDRNGYSIMRASKNNAGEWNLNIKKYLKEDTLDIKDSTDVSEIADRLKRNALDGSSFEIINFQKDSKNEFMISIKKMNKDAENEKKND